MGEWLSGIGDSISNALSGALNTVLESTIYKMFYSLEKGVCWLVEIFYEMFRVFSGMDDVTYNGESTKLIDVFFEHNTINTVYWGIALISIALCFAFTIAAVVRKTFDIDDKVQQSLGAILRSAFKSMITIFLIGFLMTKVLDGTGVLLERMTYLFDNADSVGEKSTVTFSDKDFATMARILDTIGNYSLNLSSNSTFNINSCFNEIRPDLLSLQEAGKFNVYYTTKDADGNEIQTWQSVLQSIVNSHSLTEDLKLDITYPSVSKAITEAMEILKVNDNLVPLKSYQRYYTPVKKAQMDRMLFLTGTMESAKNAEYNVHASVSDALRGPYYSGEKDMYDFETVRQDFDLSLGANSYITVFVMAYLLIKNLMIIILTCISRIFGLLVLYLVAPPIVASQPFDDGAKMKQWMTAFVIQTFGVFATIIGMRILMLFMPIVMSSKLVLFDNAFMNVIGKILLVWGAMEASNRANGMITGILANNAGMQAIHAGDMSGSIGKMGRDAMTAAKIGVGTAKAAGYGIYGIGKAGVGLVKGIGAVGSGVIGLSKWALGGSGSSSSGGNKSSSSKNKSVPGGNKSVPGGNKSVPGGNKSVPGGNKSVPGGSKGSFSENKNNSLKNNLPNRANTNTNTGPKIEMQDLSSKSSENSSLPTNQSEIGKEKKGGDEQLQGGNNNQSLPKNEGNKSVDDQQPEGNNNQSLPKNEGSKLIVDDQQPGGNDNQSLPQNEGKKTAETVSQNNPPVAGAKPVGAQDHPLGAAWSGSKKGKTDSKGNPKNAGGKKTANTTQNNGTKNQSLPKNEGSKPTGTVSQNNPPVAGAKPVGVQDHPLGAAWSGNAAKTDKKQGGTDSKSQPKNQNSSVGSVPLQSGNNSQSLPPNEGNRPIVSAPQSSAPQSSVSPSSAPQSSAPQSSVSPSSVPQSSVSQSSATQSSAQKGNVESTVAKPVNNASQGSRGSAPAQNSAPRKNPPPARSYPNAKPVKQGTDPLSNK